MHELYWGFLFQSSYNPKQSYFLGAQRERLASHSSVWELLLLQRKSTLAIFSVGELYVPDEDKSIFGRSVNKQVFEGFTTGLLQTIATVLKSLYLCVVQSGQSENFWISSSDAKVKSSAAESYSTRAQDLIRYFSFHIQRWVSLPPTWSLFFSPQNLFTSFLSSLPLLNIRFPKEQAICKE
ncbi:hypothetical protein ILYODFUR_005408 [Ilyodon furcidens]|uniref:Uncharacterized protein n=1 Tax=Ilyodon furcidens TaxID=33524 RepID=A0ABV0TG74_9TELE